MLSMGKKSKITVKVGQRWKENDVRFGRVVQVVKVYGQKVSLQNVMPGGKELNPRVTVAAKERFDGRSHGYYELTGYCHECQLARGAKAPDGPMIVTVSAGTCAMCCKDTTLVPSCDYDWPKKGKKAIWD